MPQNTNVPNIYIIGPQSTGKTTLIHKLQDDLQLWLTGTSIESPSIISEVARTVLTKHNYSAHDIQTLKTRCLELQQLILEAQAVAEEEALQTSPPGSSPIAQALIRWSMQRDTSHYKVSKTCNNYLLGSRSKTEWRPL
ncbi:unnamed protein product [Fusarium graminearum]|nr:unnamed protein product [Fusarium graminearum]